MSQYYKKHVDALMSAPTKEYWKPPNQTPTSSYHVYCPKCKRRCQLLSTVSDVWRRVGMSQTCKLCPATLGKGTVRSDIPLDISMRIPFCDPCGSPLCWNCAVLK